ncbi:MAG: FHA domain-containing protein [Deltaproteobacteria bacterium]|nr:FHA domain-containing protein [Deltaproteobacteria bacterium]
MATRRAVLAVTSGPNAGDSVRLEVGTCRLVGRHLSESETMLIDRDGNRLIDGHAADIVAKHLQDKSPLAARAGAAFSVNAFDRGADIIFADDSISRAHAMVFYDKAGMGIIDLASTNGTFLNAERVGSAMVKEGDVITVGKSDLTVRLR